MRLWRTIVEVPWTSTTNSYIELEHLLAFYEFKQIRARAKPLQSRGLYRARIYLNSTKPQSCVDRKNNLTITAALAKIDRAAHSFVAWLGWFADSALEAPANQPGHKTVRLKANFFRFKEISFSKSPIKLKPKRRHPVAYSTTPQLIRSRNKVVFRISVTLRIECRNMHYYVYF